MTVVRICPRHMVRYPKGESCPLCGDRVRNPTPQKEARKQALAHYRQCCHFDDKGVQCTVTDRSDLEAAHITPLSEGGSYSIENIVLLCKRHHRDFDQQPRSVRMATVPPPAADDDDAPPGSAYLA
jgi:5-methylcytosine-specific restriction endonuclease McrA